MAFDFIWDDLLHQPAWWILLVAGAIAGNVVPFIPKVCAAIYRLTQESALEGTWYAYHYTHLNGVTEIVESVISIKRGFHHPYTVHLSQKVDSKLKYVGYIKKEKSDIVITYSSEDHPETVENRFLEPLGSECERLYGLWLSFDHSQTIACGAILMSRSVLSPTERSHMIKKGYDHSSHPLLIRVNRL